MPKSTFERLPKQKKEELLKVALREFAENDYEHASVTRMVKTLDIAKGSVYQYFENKKDLYEYLLKGASDARRKYTGPVLNAGHEGIALLLEKFITALVKFDMEHPWHSRLLHNASNEKFSRDLGDQSVSSRKKNMDFMQGLIERELLRGNLWPDLDVTLLSFVISQVHSGITDYLMMVNKADDHAGTKKLKKQISDEMISQTARQVAEFVERGLVKRR